MAFEVTAESVTYMITEIIIGLLAIVTNGTVILTLIHTPKLHTVKNYFIISIASADMLAGIAIPPNVILENMGLPKDFYGCLAVHSSIIAFTSISILNLLGLAFDRYISIKCAKKYDKVLRPRNAVMLIVCVWIVAILIGFMPVYFWHPPKPDTILFCTFQGVISSEFNVFVFIFVIQGFPFVSLVVLLIVIYRKLHQNMAIMTEMLPFDDQEENRKFKREMTALTCIVVALVVCFLPIDILDTLALFRKNVGVPLQLILFFILLSRARAFAYPYFYVFGDMDLQKAVMVTVPLVEYIVPRIGDNIMERSGVSKYLSENPVEIVSVVLTPPPKLQARDAIVDTEPLNVYEETLAVPPPTVKEEEQMSDTETSTFSSVSQ